VRRFVLPIAAILLAAGCSSGTPTANSGVPRTPATGVHFSSAPAGGKSSPAKPKSSPSTKDCPPTRDIIVWVKAPGVPAYAQPLGNYNAATCESTFKWLQQTSPTEAGNCTEAAWASDNPGYNTEAEPAPRLKKVQVSVGPAC
jgi:hypothetical protein